MKVTEMLNKLAEDGAKGSKRIVAKGTALVEKLLPPSKAIEAIRKKVKVDHAAAMELWASGRRDARLLATMLADTGKLTVQHLDEWRMDLTDRVVTMSLGELAARGAIPLEDVARWCDDEHEWTSVLGWSIVVNRARDPRLSEEFLRGRLDRIREQAGLGSLVVNELMADVLALIAERPSMTIEVEDAAEDIMARWDAAMEQAAKPKAKRSTKKKAAAKKPAGGKAKAEPGKVPTRKPAGTASGKGEVVKKAAKKTAKKASGRKTTTAKKR